MKKFKATLDFKRLQREICFDSVQLELSAHSLIISREFFENDKYNDFIIACDDCWNIINENV